MKHYCTVLPWISLDFLRFKSYKLREIVSIRKKHPGAILSADNQSLIWQELGVNKVSSGHKLKALAATNTAGFFTEEWM